MSTATLYLNFYFTIVVSLLFSSFVSFFSLFTQTKSKDVPPQRRLLGWVGIM